MKCSRKPIQYTAVLLVLWLAFSLLLTLSAAIPKAAVKENMTAAAEYFSGRDNLYELVTGEKSTVIQDYSSALWLNVAWNLKPDAPFSSAMSAEYYQAKDSTQPESFSSAVTEGLEPNTPYGRYWHGTAAVLNLLLCVTTVQGVYILNALVLAGLLAVYFVLLLRRRLYAVGLGTALALVLCTVWVTPMSLEYTPCILLSFAASDFVLWRYEKIRNFGLFFLIMGALVCYFDFLTCEILTFALPMLLILCMDRQDSKQATVKTAKCGALWLLAYALSYLVKWILTAAVTGESIKAIALDQGAYRLTGDLGLGSVGFFERIGMAITTNLNFVFPFSLADKAAGVWMAVFGTALVLFCIWFVFRKKAPMGLLPLWLLAAVPFVRYAVLSNHAALHPFMTFRCLLITIVALAAILGMSTDCRQFRKKPVKKGGR